MKFTPSSKEPVLTKSKLLKLGSFISVAHRLPDASSLIGRYANWLEDRARNEGTLKAIELGKKVHGSCLRFAAGQKVEPIPFLRCDKDSLPSCINFLKKMLKGSPNEKRAALTITSTYKLVEVTGEDPSTEPITELGPIVSILGAKYKIGDCWEALKTDSLGHENELIQLIRKLWEETLEEEFPKSERGVRVAKLKQLSSLHISSKNGPNGPAIATAPLDLVAIKSTPIYEAVQALSRLTGNKQLTELLAQPLPSYESLKKGKEPVSSRLRVKHEEGGKTRLFAICDYYSQSALKGIHRYLFNWLGNQPEDGTFSHNQCAIRVKEWTKAKPNKKLAVYALDLSKATDRFPRALQREIMGKLFGLEISSNWEKVIADRDFLLPDESGTVRWAVGQPLGALSSWAAFAVAHHVLLRVLIKFSTLRRTKSFSHYQLIGDDISIRGSKLGNNYLWIMNLMKVKISEAKSFIPNFDIEISEPKPTTNNNSSPRIKGNAAEIAKRVFVDGYELTPIPPPGIIEGLGSSSEFPSLLQALVDRGYYAEGTVVPVPALASLSFKRKGAMLQSTFPIAAAPSYRGVTAIYREASSTNVQGWNLGDRDFGYPEFVPDWYQYPYTVVEGAFREIISRNIDEAIIVSRKEAGKQLQISLENILPFPYNQTKMKVARWEIQRASVSQVLYRTSLLSLETLEKNRKELLAPGQESSLLTSDLRRWVGKLHSCLDLKLIISGKTRYEDEKVRTSKLLSSSLQQTMKLLKFL